VHLPKHRTWTCFSVAAFLASTGVLLPDHAARAESQLVLAGNMKVLRCDMPNATYRFAGSNAPGQLFLPGEPVHVKLVFAKGTDQGEVRDFAIEIQEITTRDPQARIKEAFTDTGGNAPLLGLEGKPIMHPIAVRFDAKPETAFEVKGLPLPARFGTYALVLVRGAKRQFLATLCRVPKPREDGRIDNVPIFGEGQMMGPVELVETRAVQYQRMGIRGWRCELGWNEEADGKCNWDNYDKLFAAAEKAGCKIMVTLGGHSGWRWTFGEPTPAAGWRPGCFGYGGTGDWVCKPELYERYGKWITAFCERYWKGGRGALWGLENYNEPWEGGGISGWARDMLQYRAIQKLIATSARKVSPEIKILAASSIMNTEDKLYSDGSREFDQYIDIFTDHYVVPPMCYGPMVARAHGKESMETETWFVNAEYLLPQGVAQFMACGQQRLAPWHPRVLFDSLPGTKDEYFIPSPVVAATAALNYFVTGKKFEKIVFKEHLPWVFQYGKDDDKSALLIVFGQLLPIAGTDPKDRLWCEVDAAPGGKIIIDNADGLLQFHDLAGNPVYEGVQGVELPMTIFPTYITCRRGPAAAAKRLAAARIDGKRPVEILPRDFTERVAKGATLSVELHNCLNRAVSGRLAIETPAGLQLKEDSQAVKLAAGERLAVPFELAQAQANAANAYPFAFRFTSDAGNAEYKETLNATIIPKKTIRVDGNLDDWQDVPGVTVLAKAQRAEPTELLRRPWLSIKDAEPQGNFAQFKLAWDENYLYVAALVNDPTPQEKGLAPMAGRNKDLYFHSQASDRQSPYKEFLSKRPGRSFAEVPYVWRYNPESPDHPALPAIPFRRDRLHVALDVTGDWHDLAPDTDRVPYGFHAVPDTDYEYALYLTNQGSELWRYLAPGVPRVHDWPRQPKAKKSTGTVPGAKHVVKREGSTYIYEMAIPKEELSQLKLAAGTTLGIMLRAGNNSGPHVDFGADKAVTKNNGLTLHPYWERASNCGVRWKLVE
jgi:hypothetical protein